MLAGRVLTVIGIAAVVGGCTGDGAEVGCGETEACGGNLLGSWKVHSVCQSVPALAYTISMLPPMANTPQTPKLAKPPPTNKTSGDWCSQLVYLPPDPANDFPDGRVTSVNLYYPPAPLNFGKISLAVDHTYSATIDVESPYTTHFAPSCLIAHGANPSCTALASEMCRYYTPMPNYQKIKCCSPDSPAGQCLPDSSNGCDCSYSYRSVNADGGSWQTSDSILYMFSSSNSIQPTTQATFCARGGILTVTGRNGQSLFNVMGLRTLSLVEIPAGQTDDLSGDAVSGCHY